LRGAALARDPGFRGRGRGRGSARREGKGLPRSGHLREVLRREVRMLLRCAQHRLAPLGELPLELLPRDGLRTKNVSITHRAPSAGTSACAAPSRPGPG